MRRTSRCAPAGLLLALPWLLAAAAPQPCPRPLDACVAEKRQLYTGRGVLGFLWSIVPESERLAGRGANQYVVRAVPPGYPAKAAGLRQGDLLLAMDGKELAAVPREGLVEMSAAVAPGQTVVYRVLREGAEREVRITAAVPPASSVEAWVEQHVRESHGREDYQRYLLQVKRPAAAGAVPH